MLANHEARTGRLVLGCFLGSLCSIMAAGIAVPCYGDGEGRDPSALLERHQLVLEAVRLILADEKKDEGKSGEESGGTGGRLQLAALTAAPSDDSSRGREKDGNSLKKLAVKIAGSPEGLRVAKDLRKIFKEADKLEPLAKAVEQQPEGKNVAAVMRGKEPGKGQGGAPHKGGCKGGAGGAAGEGGRGESGGMHDDGATGI